MSNYSTDVTTKSTNNKVLLCFIGNINLKSGSLKPDNSFVSCKIM